MSELAPAITRIDRSLFSLHPEDEMTERRFHARQVEYFNDALNALFPELFVARNMAVYWVPGQLQHPYVGPDLFVSRHAPSEENPSVYLTYEDGPIAFVIEVASERTRASEPKKRDETYAAALKIPEYLYVDRERETLELWRLVDGVYQLVPPDEEGRLWSQELRVGFAWQKDRRLVRVLTADGIVVPTDQEARALQQDAEILARREARRAKQEARRAEQEARRAEQEARRRQEAEARAALLTAEVERLRRELEQRGGE
jgi:Uma2 family endonuclease